jgi:hypothetical protein
MEIKTKFKIGDIVYFKKNDIFNKINNFCKSKINKIIIYECENFEKKRLIINYSFENIDNYIEEKYIYSSEEEIEEEILKNLKKEYEEILEKLKKFDKKK